MDVISDLLRNVKIPKMFLARQIFSRERIEPEKIAETTRNVIMEKNLGSAIKPGMKIAITVGSRQIANITVITKTIVDFVKEQGGYPFIVAAMGSHGGATSKGQREILANYGITEEAMGCPIKTSMETVKIGTNEEGMDVRIGRDSAEADGIIINCRIKPHTCFKGPYESGIMKMMTIGLGKQEGADICHAAGFENMAKYVPMFGRVILRNAPILFAVAVLENVYDETAQIIALRRDEIEEKEPQYLNKARKLMPRILIPECDVLVCDQIGKNFSGSGMDPNVTGTFVVQGMTGGLKSKRVAVLDLSKESHNSGVGIGMAHATTKRFYEKMDFAQTYPNLITSTVIENARIPMVMKNDKEAIQLCIRTCTGINKEMVRIIRISNSLQIKYIQLSETYYQEAMERPDLEVLTEPEELVFDENGNLMDLGMVGKR